MRLETQRRVQGGSGAGEAEDTALYTAASCTMPKLLICTYIREARKGSACGNCFSCRPRWRGFPFFSHDKYYYIHTCTTHTHTHIMSQRVGGGGGGWKSSSWFCERRMYYGVRTKFVLLRRSRPRSTRVLVARRILTSQGAWYADRGPGLVSLCGLAWGGRDQDRPIEK